MSDDVRRMSDEGEAKVQDRFEFLATPRTQFGARLDALTRARRTWQTHRREKIDAGDFREGRRLNADV
jgi:hypothetical protein